MPAARLFALVIALGAVCGDVHAQENGSLHPWLTSKFGVDIGIFYPERRVRLRAMGSVEVDPTPNPFVDFGSEFRISQSDSTFSGEFAWRYRQRWLFLMQYFDSRGDNTAVLTEDVEWEDLVFLAGTRATAGSEFELTRFFWGYNFSKRKNSDFGAGIGFHWLHIRAYIAGTVETPTGPESDAESSSVDAPLPNIGAWYIRSLSPRWAVRARLDLFNASIDPYDGNFVNASAGLHFKLTNHLGIGASYNFVELDVGVNDDNWRGEIKTRYDGLYVYLSGHW